LTNSICTYHFRFNGIPDAVVAFGSQVESARKLVQKLSNMGSKYREIRLDVVGPDTTRPELFWRTFATVLSKPAEGTFIFKGIQP
jgi:hypothetical protein